MKRILSAVLAAAMLTAPALAVTPLEGSDITLSAPSAILIECSTGEVIYEKNAREHMSPASVTKVMTMLLVAEAVDSGAIALEDEVTASARAASMGGSQIWLEEGETMSVGEMLKCVAVVSANDCCVALAEYISGSEEAFVARMNERAVQLGMEDTHFTCCSGLLESDDHYSCARDIAVMSRELLRHEWIRDYTTVWMDTIRNGEFTLANTNKLIYYYKGATGLKTGFTTRAMYCLSASAMRDGVEYIAVVLHAPTSQERFESAKTLLDYAFANYTLADPAGSCALPAMSVRLGQSAFLQPELAEGGKILIPRSLSASLSYELELPDEVTAPVLERQILGKMFVHADGKLMQEIPVIAPDAVGRLGTFDIFLALLRCALGCEVSPGGE